MRNFQDTFKARKRSFISAFSICMTVPLIIPYISYRGVFRTLSMLKCFAKSAYRKKKTIFSRESFITDVWQDLEYAPELLYKWYYRTSRPEVFCKKVALRNFSKFIGKRLSQSLLLNKVARLRSATLFKKRLWNRCFPVNFAKSLRTPFYIEHLW